MTDPLQQLHVRYRHSLRDRQRLLEDLWRKRASDPGALAALQHAAHRLAGSAPIYGYAAIGDHARALDHAAGALGGVDDGAQQEAVAAAMQGLLAALDAAASAAESETDVADRHPARQRVLLIDDQPLRWRRLGDDLRGHGCSVRTAADETEVWQQLVTWPCTAVVIDLGLQSAEPTRLIAMIRGESRFAGLGIVALGAAQPRDGADLCDVVLAADADSAAVHAALLAAQA